MPPPPSPSSPRTTHHSALQNRNHFRQIAEVRFPPCSPTNSQSSRHSTADARTLTTSYVSFIDRFHALLNNSHCDICWNISAAKRRVFTHPSISPRCQESVRGCHGHANILNTAIESDEATLPAPFGTNITEMTLDEQNDMINKFRTRKRKRFRAYSEDEEHGDDEEV
ncbi:hypothetical protein EIP86_011300 [Pleurotus ostreatoroseus]|nr:hypothetical protein EIP86_011300 [Pleurotus ostreatoroseus]